MHAGIRCNRGCAAAAVNWRTLAAAAQFSNSFAAAGRLRPVVPAGKEDSDPEQPLGDKAPGMIFDQRVETPGGNRGHSCEDSEAPRERFEFMPDARIFVAKQAEDDQNEEQAEGDRYTGSHHETRQHSERTHLLFPIWFNT